MFLGMSNVIHVRLNTINNIFKIFKSFFSECRLLHREAQEVWRCLHDTHIREAHHKGIRRTAPARDSDRGEYSG